MLMKFSCVLLALILIENSFVLARGQLYSYNEVRYTFMTSLIKQLGDGSNITVREIEGFYSMNDLLWDRLYRKPVLDCLANMSSGSPQEQESCLLDRCLDPTDVYKLSGLSINTSDKEVSTMSMILLHLLESRVCKQNVDIQQGRAQQHDEPPTTIETWGYGILCTSIIVLAALGGFLALPFIHGVNYKKALIFMVGLAVGTLAGSSLLFLAPEALELTDQEMNEHNYVWKCLVMVTAIYSFFIIERVLKMITGWRERKRRKPVEETENSISFISLPVESKNRVPNYTDLDNTSRDSGIDTVTETTDKGIANSTGTDVKTDVTYICNKDLTEQDGKHTAPVAWMILFGDAVHNFVDGVSIGAAFTESVLAGVSVSVAVFCEELPHELGDFAVLLCGGLSKKRAVIYNFLSACTIYIGMVVGIFLGENESAHTWVFAFAGGMFLYIALVDMMPEMCASGERKENRKLIGTGTIFLLQNLGMLTGFGIILILAIYGGNLENAITGE